LAIDKQRLAVSLDHDRKGVSGMPDLANVIVEKIRGCANTFLSRPHLDHQQRFLPLCSR
jgi:hypothetical protein